MVGEWVFLAGYLGVVGMEDAGEDEGGVGISRWPGGTSELLYWGGCGMGKGM